MENEKLIVVLGMHRSGTSAITRSLQVLGVELGEALLPVNADNPKGFFEDRDINALNIELLARLGQNWDHLTPVTAEHVAHLHESELAPRALDLLERKLAQHSVFGLKDPRLSKLLPFWQPLFEQLSLNVSYIISLRNPKSVCESLAKRNGFTPEKSYLLWLYHTIDSLKYTWLKAPVLVEFDFLMKDPETVLRELAKNLNLSIDANKLQVYRDSFLESKLRHSTFQAADLLNDPASSAMVYDVYGYLLNLYQTQGSLQSEEFFRHVTTWEQQLASFEIAFRLIDQLTVGVSTGGVGAQGERLDEFTTIVKECSARIDYLSGQNSKLVSEISALTQELALSRTRTTTLEAYNSTIETSMEPNLLPPNI